MAKVSRAYIKGTGAGQSGSIQAGSTIYAQDILDLIDSAKWHDEGIESISYDDSSNSLKVVKSSDPNNPVHFPVPKNSDIVNKLVKGVDKYELRSDSGLVAETDLPSTLVTSVTCDKNANELQVSSTSSNSGITVPLPDSLKSAAIEGNDINFTSLDGQQSVINLPDSLKSVSMEGNALTFTSLEGAQSTIDLPDSLKRVAIWDNTLTFTSIDGTPTVINLPVTTGYLSDVSLEDGTLVFTKDGSSDVRITLPFVSKAITGVSLQGSNLVFTYSDNTTASIALPTQSEGGTTAGLLSGVRIDGNRLVFTVSGGNDITIELPSTPGGSGDVDLTGLLFNPSYSKGTLYFATKNGNVASVDIPGVFRIDGLRGENLEYTDVKGNSSTVSLSNLTKGVLTGASVGGDNLVFTTKDSDNISIPLSSITNGVLTGASLSDSTLTFTANDSDSISVPLNSLTSGVLTGVSLSDGNLVFTVKGGDNITIPLSGASDVVKDVTFDSSGRLRVTKKTSSTDYNILPNYVDRRNNSYDSNFGWGGSLGYFAPNAYGPTTYSPVWVPNGLNYMEAVIESNVSFRDQHYISIGSSSPDSVENCSIYDNYYVSADGRLVGGNTSSDNIRALYCYNTFSESFSESSGTFTANVYIDAVNNKYYVLLDNSIRFYLNGNILEAFPNSNTASIVNLLKYAERLSNFGGFAFRTNDLTVLINKEMFFAKKVFDWSYNAASSFGMRVYLGKYFSKESDRPFYAQAGKVLD